MNHDHIKGKDTLRIQSTLDSTDAFLMDYVNTTKKSIEVISTQLLYDTAIITQLAKKSTPLNSIFQISILAIQLKCISNIFKIHNADNSDFFKFWRTSSDKIKHSFLSKIDSYSIHQEYFYLQKNHKEQRLNSQITNYLFSLIEFIDFENSGARIEVKTNIDALLFRSLGYSEVHFKNIAKELLKVNQIETSEDRVQIPSTSELRSLLSAKAVNNEKIEYEYFIIISKSLDFLEQTKVTIFQKESELMTSDNTTTLSDLVNQICNLTRVFNYVYLLILRLQESALTNDLLTFQTIVQTLDKLEILNTQYEDSILNKLDSLIEINQKNNEHLTQLIDYAQEISDSIKQTNTNLITISKNLETLESSLNQAFKQSLQLIDFSVQSGFLVLNQQIHDLNKKVQLQTLISSVNYYKDNKINISISRELNRL